MFTQIKLAIYLAAFAAIIGGVYWFNGVLDERTKLKADKVINLQTIADLTQEKKDNLQQQIKDNQQSIKHQHELEEIKNEKITLRNELDSGSRVVRIKAACPQLPNAEPNSTGVTYANPELTRDARAGYIDLIEQIKQTNLLVAAMKRRIAEDYEKCGNKLEKLK